MKKAIYFLMTLFLILASCDPMAEIYDAMEDMDTGYAAEFTYDLGSDDYAAIADMTSNGDAADFIEDNEAFSDEYPASLYLPAYIEELYPALGKNSVGKIGYNFFMGYPEYLDNYYRPETYYVSDDDYNSMGGDNQTFKTLIGDDKPEDYIPGFLEAEYPDAAEDDVVLALYKYAAEINDPSVVYAMQSDDFQVIVDHVANDINPDYVSGYGDSEYYYGASAYYTNFDARVSERIMDITGDDTTWVAGFEGLNMTERRTLIDERLQLAIVYWLEQTYPDAVPEIEGQTVYYNIQYDTYDGSGHTYYVVYECTASGPPATFELVDGPSEDFLVYSSTVKEDRGMYFQFDGSEWVAMDGVHYLSSADYDNMGAPGKYNNFSSTDRPENYIPQMLDEMYPYAQQGDKKAVSYRYYSSGSTTVRAMEFIFDNMWTPYNPYTAKQDQFIHNGTDWVFDPTVMFTMGSSDYMIIVNYVKNNIGASYVDSYGTAEFYSGASAYYGNFDIRSGNFDDTVFDSWEDALEFAIGEALLPTKYPDAVAQVSGIDVFYIVTFDTYSGVAGRYSMKFQVTKAGPNPEFTLDEGPTAN
ncbi:MAG: hypothetical protein RQ743_03735 [Bacteroidales bacterium]|nr:hypothetical protein [Bacteroidales bacterium]